MAEFLFERWILKELCTDGNKNGLVTNLPIQGELKRNLSLIKDALTALISDTEDYEIIISDLPSQVS